MWQAILIYGPTASGKSALALELAARHGGLIINADAMQVYRDLRIITARPSPADEQLAPHALYGHIDAAEPYSVGRWLIDAADALARARRAGQLPIVVGGTGLYFKALTEGLAPVPAIAPAVRARVRADAEGRSSEALHGELLERDPETARQLNPADRQRILRALEVLAETGRPLAQWQRGPARALLPADACRRIHLTRPREVLHARIDARFDAMIAMGALDEVRALAARGLDPQRSVMRAHGVPALMRHLAGRMSLAEAIAEAKLETRQYVKRQATWARKHMIGWETVELRDET